MEYIRHLSKDKTLRKLLQKHEPVKLVKRRKVLIHLCGCIMSQQLSVKVADVIHKRFLHLFGGDPTALQILDTPMETLRSIGLSRAKAQYVRNVAQFALEQGIEYRKLNRMSNEAVMEYLMQIKGVGRWTSEILLMFILGREDVFCAQDLGIRQAMTRLYQLDDRNDKNLTEQMLEIAASWSPYRTYACVHLWRYKDNSPEK